MTSLLATQGAGAEDAGPALRADGLAARVGKQGAGESAELILRSDVELRARMALASQGVHNAQADDIALSAQAPPASLLQATLNELIGEALIAREAQRVQIAMPSASDIARERNRLMLMVGGPTRMATLLEAVSAQPAEIDAIARRRAVAAAFLSANLEGAMAVTDGEIEQRYRAEAQSFAGRDAGEVRESIRARLAREALARNIERWVRVLRARTEVRVAVDFEAHGGAG